MKGRVEYSQEGVRKPTKRWVAVWVPKEFVEDLQPMVEQNKMTISDVITILAIEGGMSLQQRSDMEHARSIGAAVTCPVCGHIELVKGEPEKILEGARTNGAI